MPRSGLSRWMSAAWMNLNMASRSTRCRIKLDEFPSHNVALTQDELAASHPCQYSVDPVHPVSTRVVGLAVDLGDEYTALIVEIVEPNPVRLIGRALERIQDSHPPIPLHRYDCGAAVLVDASKLDRSKG